MAVGSQARHQIHQKIGGTLMATVFNLGNVLQLVIDGFRDRTFALRLQVEQMGSRETHPRVAVFARPPSAVPAGSEALRWFSSPGPVALDNLGAARRPARWHA